MNKIENVYHYVSNGNVKNIQKIGLCSPRYLKENYPDIFEKSSYEIWKDRASEFFKKEKASHEDVLNYLDRVPKNKGKIGSKTLFFLFLPISQYEEEIQENFNKSVQCEIPVSLLKFKTPYLIYKGKINESSWDHILNKSFYDKIIVESKNKIGKFIFSNITHLAVNIEHISAKDLNLEVFEKKTK